MFGINNINRFVAAAMMSLVLSSPVSADKPIIPQSWVDACLVDPDKCWKIEKELIKVHDVTEAKCALLTDLGDRKDMINDLINIEKIRDVFGFDGSNIADLCAGTLNPEITYISFEPGEALDLSIDDEVEFTATINCMTCNLGVCMDAECEGKLSWALGGTEVAELFNVDKNKATIKAIGSGFDAILARSQDIPDIYDFAQIEVEAAPSVDIAFVVYNGNKNFDNFPPYGYDLFTAYVGDWYDKIKVDFDTFDLSLVNYNRKYNPNGLDWCGFNSGPLDQYRVQLGFGTPQSNLKQDWLNAWGRLNTVCDNAHPDMGNSLYSALIYTIQHSNWSGDAKTKAIIVLPKGAVCYVINEGECDSEPDSGLSLSDVHQAANNAGVKLYFINTYNVSVLPECGGAGCISDNLYCYQAISARNTYQSLANLSGGKYYSAWVCDYQHWNDAVIQAIDDIRALSGGEEGSEN